jgi:hypothetical protein
MEQYVDTIELTLKDEAEIKNFTTRTVDNTISISVDLLEKSERKKE